MNGYAVVNNPIATACLGDRLTGWTDAIGPGYFKGWVQLLQESRPNRVITNFGVGGFVSSSIRDRWLTMVKNCGYRQITVLGGINDIVGSNPSSTVITNLDTIYDQAIALSVKIIALTVTPFGGHASWNSTRQTYLEDVNSHIAAKVAANPTLMTLVDAHAMLKDSGDSTRLNTSYDSGDYLHWNGAGHSLVFNAVKEVLS